jgi:hypothetical protein
MTSLAPLILSENFYNTIQYPDHVITASEEAAGHEAFRVGNGRRSSLDYWTSTSTNTVAYNRVVCDRVRAANCIVIDRGHNLAGYTVKVHTSSDFASSTEEAASIVLPTATMAGSVDDPYGIRTEEGAWICRFPLRAGTGWQVYVPAMGVGLKPQIVGIWLGLAWSPARPFDLPWAEEDDEILADDSFSDAGWMGSSTPYNRRGGTLGIRLLDGEYDAARLHLGFYRDRAPTWIVHDINQSERAVCAIRPAERFGFQLRPDWLNKRRAEVPWVEYEPKP